MRFRQSMIKTWMGCPLQAKFMAIDLLPRKQSGKASFGTIIHFCLEQYNKDGNLPAAVETFKELWSHPERLGVTPDYWPKFTTYGGLRQRGIEILNEYDTKNKWENRKVIATEHRFLVPLGEHELEGSVDLLELKKNQRGHPTLRVVDYKTNSKAPYVSELRLNIQFTAYVYASLQPEFWLGNGPEFPGMVDGEKWYNKLLDSRREGIWYHLWGNKEISAGPRGDDDFMRLYRACCEIEKAIKNDVYVPNISGETCTFCDYVEPCGLPISPREYTGEEE